MFSMATKAQNDLIAALLSELGADGPEWEDYMDDGDLMLIGCWEEGESTTVAEASEIIEALKEVKQQMER